MIKVHILDQCEFCDGEVLMCEARCLTVTDFARCAREVVIRRSGMNITFKKLIIESTMLLNFRHVIGQWGMNE